mmetsp:Transcript_41392/g.81105  ORF Transcript_41392/g.81105 Transcript_41392/m.81105 type:complete len:244 (+) Transcript_41392:253-984(+)
MYCALCSVRLLVGRANIWLSFPTFSGEETRHSHRPALLVVGNISLPFYDATSGRHPPPVHGPIDRLFLPHQPVRRLSHLRTLRERRRVPSPPRGPHGISVPLHLRRPQLRAQLLPLPEHHLRIFHLHAPLRFLDEALLFHELAFAPLPIPYFGRDAIPHGPFGVGPATCPHHNIVPVRLLVCAQLIFSLLRIPQLVDDTVNNVLDHLQIIVVLLLIGKVLGSFVVDRRDAATPGGVSFRQKVV